MAGRHHEDDRVCRCDQAGGTCAGLAVRRLSGERVHQLAEEIWAASSAGVPPLRPFQDPRGSRAGASAQAAYRRHRRQEFQAWRRGWHWRAGAALAVAIGGGVSLGLTVGARLGWLAAPLAGLLAGWRLRFRPSAGARLWRRQAAVQRRTAGLLRPLQEEGFLLLHDVTLPGWPASLDHLVVGTTGVWVIRSWWRGRWPLGRGRARPWRAGGVAGSARELRLEAAAVAMTLTRGVPVPVRSLLCVHGGVRLGGGRLVEGVRVAGPRRVADAVRQGPRLSPGDVQRASASALDILRPAV